MKKNTIATLTIACLIAVLLSTFVLSHVQTVESAKMQNEKVSKDANAQSDSSADSQTFSSDDQQFSSSDTIRNSGQINDSPGIQNAQIQGKNESSCFLTETSQSQSSELPLPLPDGRIFLGLPMTEDAIPYIPTENPKTGTRTPILPPEVLD